MLCLCFKDPPADCYHMSSPFWNTISFTKPVFRSDCPTSVVKRCQEMHGSHHIHHWRLNEWNGWQTSTKLKSTTWPDRVYLSHSITTSHQPPDPILSKGTLDNLSVVRASAWGTKFMAQPQLGDTRKFLESMSPSSHPNQWCMPSVLNGLEVAYF